MYIAMIVNIHFHFLPPELLALWMVPIVYLSNLKWIMGSKNWNSRVLLAAHWAPSDDKAETLQKHTSPLPHKVHVLDRQHRSKNISHKIYMWLISFSSMVFHQSKKIWLWQKALKVHPINYAVWLCSVLFWLYYIPYGYIIQYYRLYMDVIFIIFI